MDEHEKSGADDTADESLAALREKKTEECMLAALANEDPLMAGAAIMNADMLFYAQEARRIIEPALKSASADNVQEIMHLLPALEMPLRLCRQSVQISAFMERLKRQQAAIDKAMAGMATSPVAVEQSGNT